MTRRFVSISEVGKILANGIVMLLFLAGCAHERAEVTTPSVDERLPVREPDYSRGSLWQGEGGLVADHKARGVGDTLTILIVESASASKQASTDTKRSSSISAGVPNFLGLEKSRTVTGWADLANLINASTANSFGGSGSTSRKESLTATISAKVLSVLPNGNLKVEGRRNVRVNGEDQIIKVEGTVRPRDISTDNTITSTLIADARITYAGKGIVSDQQEQGWLMRFINMVWPF